MLEGRLRAGVGILSVLLVLVVVNALLHGDEHPLNPIAAAAERTQEQPGARFTMKATYTSSALPQPVVARGQGAYNSESGLAEATLNVDSPTDGPVTVRSVGDGTAYFIGGDTIGGELPEGKTWLKVEPFLGHSQEELALSGGSGVESSFGALSSVDGDAERLGREQVRGVSTRHYRAHISYDRYADLLREEGKGDLADEFDKYGALIPNSPLVEAWIDGKGILRRMRMVMALPTATGQPSLTMDMRMELFDVGARPPIVLPDPATVFDATPLLREQLDAIDAG
jgi:hypothetical protein